jgi:hypothetical protein
LTVRTFTEFHRGVAPSAGPESTHVLERPLGVVLRRVSALYGVAHAFASCGDGPDPDLTPATLKRAERILEERSIPADGLQRPTSNEHSSIDDHRPDAGKPMLGTSACLDAEVLRLVDCLDD